MPSRANRHGHLALVKLRRWRHHVGMARVLMLLGIAAVIASPASASLKPDPKPISRPQPAPPPPTFQRVAPAPVAVPPTAAELAVATRAAKARAARLARLRASRGLVARVKAARAKAARDAAPRKSIESSRRSQREAIVSQPKAAAVPDSLLGVPLGFTIAFLLLAASPASAIPWPGPARVLVAQRRAFAFCGAAGLVAVFVAMVL